MKALLFDGPGSAVVRDVEGPRPTGDEVLIRPSRVGICRSDLDLLAGEYILPIPWPVVPGHEWTGVIEQVGDASGDLRPGDHVVGECAVAPDTHVGFTVDGAAAELLVARPTWLHKLPDGFDVTLGALVEPFTVGFAATDGVDASDDVVVLGGGPIGLCAVAAAKARGARVLLVDPHGSRLSLARSLGADETCRPHDDVEAITTRMTDGRMASRVVEAAGRTRALARALDLAGYGGTIVALGITVGSAEPAALGLIMGKSLTVKGQVGSPGVWPEAIRFMDRLDLDLSSLVTETFGLADGVGALEAAGRTDTVKVHLAIDGE